MIRAGEAARWNDLASKRSKAALHAVANDSPPDLFGDGEADAHARVLILAVADEQDETGGSYALAAIGGDEVRALADRG